MSIRDGIFSKWLFSTKSTRIPKSQTSAKMRYALSNTVAKLEWEYFQTIAKAPVK